MEGELFMLKNTVAKILVAGSTVAFVGLAGMATASAQTITIPSNPVINGSATVGSSGGSGTVTVTSPTGQTVGSFSGGVSVSQ